MVGFCAGGTGCFVNCVDNGKLPGDKGRDVESGAVITNGVKLVNGEWAMVNVVLFVKTNLARR